MASLFEQLIEACGLSRAVAPFTLSRLLLRARVFNPRAVTVAQLREALPHLEAGLGEFLPPAELRQVVQALVKLAQEPGEDRR